MLACVVICCFLLLLNYIVYLQIQRLSENIDKNVDVILGIQKKISKDYGDQVKLKDKVDTAIFNLNQEITAMRHENKEMQKMNDITIDTIIKFTAPDAEDKMRYN